MTLFHSIVFYVPIPFDLFVIHHLFMSMTFVIYLSPLVKDRIKLQGEDVTFLRFYTAGTDKAQGM